MSNLLMPILKLAKSKTFWVNIGLAAAVCGLDQVQEVVKDNPDLAVLVTTIINIGLRMLTKKPLSEK